VQSSLTDLATAPKQGDDIVIVNAGTFYGQEGDEFVLQNEGGATFYGGEGLDSVGVGSSPP
jgi:hypothetical protein